MTRILAASLTLAAPAFAHDGAHAHPHGIEFGWIFAVVVGVAGGWAAARLRGRK